MNALWAAQTAKIDLWGNKTNEKGWAQKRAEDVATVEQVI